MSEVLHVEVGKGSKNEWRFERLAARGKECRENGPVSRRPAL